MKILCCYSSIEFTVEHIPGSYTHGELSHPIFQIPQKKLLSYAGKFSAGHLTPTDSYLLFLAILNSSELVHFRTPAIRTPRTDSIVYNNMEKLLRTVILLNTVPSPEETFPQYAITPETRTLDNVSYWLQNWQDRYQEFKSGYRSAHESAIINRRDAALLRLLKSPHKSLSSYSSQLADWAAIAASFPTFLLSNNPLYPNLPPISCADYWKEILVRCTKQDYIFSIPDNDLQELLEHCETNLEVGSLQSNAVFKILRTASARKRTFLDLGDPDLSRTSYSILSKDDSVEGANLRAVIDSAPTEKPERKDYPSDFQFNRATLRWLSAQKMKP